VAGKPATPDSDEDPFRFTFYPAKLADPVEIKI
jgi:hypothetical protein